MHWRHFPSRTDRSATSFKMRSRMMAQILRPENMVQVEKEEVISDSESSKAVKECRASEGGREGGSEGGREWRRE
eukprot:3934068-Rhodomonas_salina.1